MLDGFLFLKFLPAGNHLFLTTHEVATINENPVARFFLNQEYPMPLPCYLLEYIDEKHSPSLLRVILSLRLRYLVIVTTLIAAGKSPFADHSPHHRIPINACEYQNYVLPHDAA